MRIGVDAGGTFTDFVVLRDDGTIDTFKLRSNPHAPDQVILAGLERAAGRRRAEVIHGSTVATNALLERKGVRTAFVTTAGFEDMLAIARQNRRELYNLTPVPVPPLIPRRLCFGVGERTFYDGEIERRPSASEVRALAARLRRAGARSVAICLLHSYQNAENEKKVAQGLAAAGYVCASHEISPEFREYERASTTVINAYVGPLMAAYLDQLSAGSRHRIFVMQSNGGFLTAREASRQAVRTVLSGPAGGVVGASGMARRAGFRKILGFDMGGTSTDVSLCAGEPRETTEAAVDGLPVRIPMIDIHTVGAGGGSIASVDVGGLLRVGPESAGADPGPACYGRGIHATVTDAQVVLGRLDAGQFLGGAMTIQPGRAEAAIGRLAKAMRTSVVQAAEGIVQVANANMERAIRAVSVERGHDPRDYALTAFGGGGGLHACEIAAELGIRHVLVPRFAESLSALGMLMADAVRDYAAGVLGGRNVERAFQGLESRARKDLPGCRLERTADLRYQGQSYELNVTWNPRDPGRPFHREHERVYGYSDARRAVEIVTIRVRARQRSAKPRLGAYRLAPAEPARRRVFVQGAWRDAPVLPRNAVARRLPGPALILDYGTTTLVPPGWLARLDRTGNLLLEPRSRRAGY